MLDEDKEIFFPLTKDNIHQINKTQILFFVTFDKSEFKQVY